MRKWHSAIFCSAALACLLSAAEMLSAQSADQSSNKAATAAMEREFQDAMAAMSSENQGDLDRAEALLVSLRSRHRGIFAVDESLGLLYARRERFNDALPPLKDAVHDAPSSDAAHANLGATYFKLGRNAEALGEFQRAAELNPRNVETQKSLGQLWMEMRKPERAAEAFAAALELTPGDAGLLLERAQAVVEAGHPDDGAKVLAGLPAEDKLEPDQASAEEVILGDIEEKKGAFQQAGQHYSRAVELDPSEENVWALGEELLRHWTFEPAIKEFEAATVKFPQSARMKLGLGTAVFGVGKFERAIEIYSELLASDKSNALYAQLLGVACSTVAEGEQPQCAALVPYAEAHPADAKTAVHASAWIEKQAPTAERAALERRLLENAVAADPKLAEAQYRLGLLQQDKGQWEQSIPHLEAAVKLDAELAEAHYRLGQAYWRAGRKTEAEPEMELYRKYRAKKMEDRDHRLSQIMTLIVEMRN